MNKTITASIGGFVFNIEEDAYEKLYSYLRDIRVSLGNDESILEIMNDIELRIAEIFRDIIDQQKKEVLVLLDVLEVISIMGEPEAYGTAEEKKEREIYSSSYSDKQFFRDPDDRLIGGVCSGISKYFGWDPLFLRIVFVVMAFGMGFGFLFYLILWFIIPEAKSTADKLRMRGEKIDVETIRQRFYDFKKDVEKFASPESKRKMRERSGQLVSNAKGVFSNIVEIAGKTAGFVFVIIGILLMIWLVKSLISSEFIFSITDTGINALEYDSFAVAFFGNETRAMLVWLALTGLLLVPVTAFIMGGIRMLTGKRIKAKTLNISLIIISTFSVITLLIISISTGLDFTNEKQVEQILPLDETGSDTLYLYTNKDIYFSDHFENHHNEFFELMKMEEKSIIYGFPFLQVEKSKDEQAVIYLERVAHGSNQKEAIDRAENIQYEFHQKDSALYFNPWFSVPQSDLIRGQQLKIVIMIPEGKTIYLSPQTERIIYDIQNTTGTRDRDMPGKFWTMTSEGLALAE